MWISDFQLRNCHNFSRSNSVSWPYCNVTLWKHLQEVEDPKTTPALGRSLSISTPLPIQDPIVAHFEKRV